MKRVAEDEENDEKTTKYLKRLAREAKRKERAGTKMRDVLAWARWWWQGKR